MIWLYEPRFRYHKADYQKDESEMSGNGSGN